VDSLAQTLDAIAEETPNGVILALRGELDIPNVHWAEAELQRAEHTLDGASPLVLDLRALDFMDSTGLRFILSAHARALEAGRRFLVVRGPEAVQRVFRATRVDAILEIVDDAAPAPSS
jgi:anti-sigma B factor antagonist